MTKIERTLLQLGALLLVIGACWWGFSSHYERKGYQRCQAEAQAAADKREKHEREESRDIGKDTDDKAKEDVRQVDDSTAKTKEVIREVYRDRPVAGSCHRDLDQRVQERFEAAVRSANAGSL